MTDTVETEVTETTEPTTKNAVFGERYLRNRPFLIIDATARAADQTNTSKKGWNLQQGNWRVFERASIHDRVSDKQMREATIIIDILNNKVVKNRFADQSEDEQVLQHFISKYGKEVTEGLERWANTNKPVPKVSIIPDEVVKDDVAE